MEKYNTSNNVFSSFISRFVFVLTYGNIERTFEIFFLWLLGLYDSAEIMYGAAVK